MNNESATSAAKPDLSLKALVTEALKAKGLNGLTDDWECVCHVDDLMPCDNPEPHCRGCKVKSVVNCEDEDCEYQGDQHFHEVKDEPEAAS